MANSIKGPRSEPALQVTEDARAAGLVEEDKEGEVRRRAKVVVAGFDGLLVVMDREQIPVEERWELVQAAGGDTRSIHRITHAKIRNAGDGYSVQLRPAPDAGFEVGDRAPVYPARGAGLLAITDSAGKQQRVAKDLVTIRQEQVG